LVDRCLRSYKGAASKPPLFFGINKSMKTPFKELLGILLVGAFITILALGLKHLQKPNPLEKIEEKIKKVKEKEIVLTPTEKELEKKATEKEWEEVDKESNK